MNFDAKGRKLFDEELEAVLKFTKKYSPDALDSIKDLELRIEEALKRNPDLKFIQVK